MHTICIVHMLYVFYIEIHTYTYNTYMCFWIHTRYAHAGSLMSVTPLKNHEDEGMNPEDSITLGWLPIQVAAPNAEICQEI